MRKSDLKARHEYFDQAVARYRSFCEKIISAQRVVSIPAEKRDIAESVLLRLVANWEYFVDEHLVACVNRDHSKLKEYLNISLNNHPSLDLCRALIFGGGYKNFTSMGDLVGFSRRILPNESNPFVKISKVHRDKIDEVYKIRNYLSHYSSLSERSLRRMYKEIYKYDRWIEPGRFLLGSNAKRLWNYFDAFEGASKAMQKF